MLPNERTTRNEVAATPGEVEGLVVAPDRDAARPLVEFLRAEGVNVQVVGSTENGFEEALLHRPNVVLVDEHISSAGGVDLCSRLKANARTHFLPVILFSHSKDLDLLRLDAMAAGVDALFTPATSREERRARLWALLRSQAIFRKFESKRQAQSNAISNKRRWVRGLVHDIQNSLGAIQANFEYIAQQCEALASSKPDEFDECVHETRTTFREMVRNLRTVLEFERFEAGDVVLKEGRLMLSDVAEAVRTSLGHLAVGSNKEIVIESASYSQSVAGDENYLREAVGNLATYVLQQSDNHRCYLVASSETGVAQLRVYGDKHEIPASVRAGLFDPYSGQSKDRPTRVAHRVGLALAKVIVEVHHGALWIEDTKGAGTAFVLEFPSHWQGRGQPSDE
jgi:two-component system, sensor histidine kinase